VGSGPIALQVADFGGAFGTDLAVSNHLSGTVTVLSQAADRSFQPVIGGSTPAGQSVGLGVGDFNGDGRTDFVASDSGGGVLWVMLRNTARLFGLMTASSGAAAHEEADILTAQGTVALTYGGGF
jgi:hypothetical protein